jgi:hypothetical protein
LAWASLARGTVGVPIAVSITVSVAVAVAALAIGSFGADDGDVAGGFAAWAGGFGGGFAEQAKGQKTENLLECGLLGGFGSVRAKRVAATILRAALTATIGSAPSFSLRSLGI